MFHFPTTLPVIQPNISVRRFQGLMMKNSKSQRRLLLAAILLLVIGCAPAYHSYSGCRVNCRYCTPCPLEYSHYCDGQCHSRVASKHLTTGLQSPEFQSE